MSQPTETAQKNDSAGPSPPPRAIPTTAEANLAHSDPLSSPFPSVSSSPETVSSPPEVSNPTGDDSAMYTDTKDSLETDQSVATPTRPPHDSQNCIPARDGLTERLFRSKARTPVATIFIHAGAGFHSTANEHVHLEACSEAARLAMKFLKAGGTAVDAVEVAIKSLEDREITNAGYGSNLTIDGVVEGDATIVDHLGRSGACGAVPMIKNPISLARLILDQTNIPLSLRRIPPNILVSAGARRFAEEHGMRTVPNEKLVSEGARARFDRWRHELYRAEAATSSTHRTAIADSTRQGKRTLAVASTPELQARPGQTTSSQQREQEQPRSGQLPGSKGVDPAKMQDPTSVLNIGNTAGQASTLGLSTTGQQSVSGHFEEASGGATGPDRQRHTSTADSVTWPSQTTAPPPKRLRMDRNEHTIRKRGSKSSVDGHSEALPPNIRLSTEQVHESAEFKDDNSDIISDTVGAIAVDFQGNIAAGSSSGGIGMKHSGRMGPAALVGIGTAVLPANPKDKMGTSVAAVTSGTGEHMATTMASHTCAERLYYNMRVDAGGSPVAEYDDDTLMKTFVSEAFMDHPGVKNQVSGGAIGVMAVKKTCKGVYFYFAHNTDSFALASLSSNEKDPLVVMSRLGSRESVARGGRKIKNN